MSAITKLPAEVPLRLEQWYPLALRQLIRTSNELAQSQESTCRSPNITKFRDKESSMTTTPGNQSIKSSKIASHTTLHTSFPRRSQTNTIAMNTSAIIRSVAPYLIPVNTLLKRWRQVFDGNQVYRNTGSHKFHLPYNARTKANVMYNVAQGIQRWLLDQPNLQKGTAPLCLRGQRNVETALDSSEAFKV
ncbi:hypothetical protein BC835DRAFT_1446650, partial [Cytidiella melzeri]